MAAVRRNPAELTSGDGNDSAMGLSAETTCSADGPVSDWKYRLVAVRHYRQIHGYAAAILRNPDDAEDVTQDAFERYWRQGGNVKNPRHWLLRVTRNLCLDRLRVADRNVPHADEQVIADPTGRDPEWHYSQAQLSTELEQLVRTLPEPQRSLIVLFDLQGMTGAQCAEILGINVNQVKVYLHRARRRLRQQLEQSS
jgi:RNA polymerase sigma-70 factor (ECF subfamily)